MVIQWPSPDLSDLVVLRWPVTPAQRAAWARPAGHRDRLDREAGRSLGYDHLLRAHYAPLAMGLVGRTWRDVLPCPAA